MALSERDKQIVNQFKAEREAEKAAHQEKIQTVIDRTNEIRQKQEAERQAELDKIAAERGAKFENEVKEAAFAAYKRWNGLGSLEKKRAAFEQEWSTGLREKCLQAATVNALAEEQKQLNKTRDFVHRNF